MLKKIEVVMVGLDRDQKPNEVVIFDKYWQPCHLYFLSDEKIKLFDWCYDKILGVIFQTDECTDYNYVNNTYNVLKIIATTDNLRVKHPNILPDRNLPKPSDSFVEAFIDQYNIGKIITNVMVEYKTDFGNGKKSIVIDFLKINPKDNTITIRKIKDSWNREEVIKLFGKAQAYGIIKPIVVAEIFNKWIEENL